MPKICLCFEVHQPMRFKHSSGSTDGLKEEYLVDHFLNNGLNKFVFDRASKKCYWPTINILLENVETFKKEKKKFKFGLNISGIWIEQCERWQPDLLEYLKQLAESKSVEFLGSTYFHSLASLFKSHNEFIEQVNSQNELMKDLLGVKPSVFINTEMIFNNLIAKTVEDMGYQGIFTEGIEKILEWRSPNYVYARGPVKKNDKPLDERIKVLLRNYRLSDDIGYRFSAREWDQWPLTAEKYAIWLSSTPGQVINIFMDFETFGEHHPEESGILFFLKALPWKVFDWQNLEFITPSEVIKTYKPLDEIDVHEFNTISRADMERDTSAWLGNSMQQMAFEELKKLEPIVKRNNNRHLLRFWRLLQQSDHLYYMCTKWWSDGDVHKYFSPFSTPHDGFINIVSGISEIKVRMARKIGRVEAITKKEALFKPSEIEIPIRTEKKKKKKKIKIETELKEEVRILEPLKPKTVIDSILEWDVIYPRATIELDDIQKLSRQLNRRVR